MSIGKSIVISYKEPLIFPDSFIFECEIPRGYEINTSNVEITILEIDIKSNKENLLYFVNINGNELFNILTNNIINTKVFKISHVKLSRLIGELEIEIKSINNKEKKENFSNDLIIEEA